MAQPAAFVLDLLKKTPYWLIIFIWLGCLFSSPLLTSNEEHYLQLSKQFFSPDWLPNSITFTEAPGTRYLFQIMAGYFLDKLSFETVAIYGRWLLALCFSLPIAKLIRLLKLPLAFFLIAFQLLYLKIQSLLGHENLFLDLEPKEFAYVLVFWSLYYLFEGKNTAAVLLATAATWFHVLVGGWHLFAVFIYLIIGGIQFSKLVKLGLMALIGAVPAFSFLILNAGLHENNSSELPRWTWIYAYFRHPHHMGIFRDWNYFVDAHLKGTLATLLALVSSIVILIRSRIAQKAKLVLRMITILFASSIFFVIVAAFDNQGVLLVSQPFRPNAIATFLSLLLTLFFFVDFLRGFAWFPSLRQASIFFAMSAFVYFNICQYQSFRQLSQGQNAIMELSEYAKANTARSSKFVFMPLSDDFGLDGKNSLSFTRLALRDRFVVYKFVPAMPGKLNEWYRRVLLQKQLLDNWEIVFTLKEKYDVEWFVDYEQRNHARLKEVYRNTEYFLYEIQ